MKKRIFSLVAFLICVTMVAMNVLAAYPVGYKTQDLQTRDLTDDESVVYESENPADLYAFSPAICRTSTGRLIVSYDLGGDGAQSYVPQGHTSAPGWTNVGVVAYSDDGGKKFTTVLEGNFLFARPFEVTNARGETTLYVIARGGTSFVDANGNKDGNTVIYKSTDDGKTWSEPSEIHVNAFHSAPTEVHVLDGYVYMTMEYTDFVALPNILDGEGNVQGGRGSYAPVIWRASVDSDLMSGDSWKISENTLCYLDAVGWNGTAEDATDSYSAIDYMGVPRNWDGRWNIGWLEGNLVQIYDTNNELYADNTFYVYLRSTALSSGYANLMKIELAEDGTMTPSLVTSPSGKTQLYVHVPGGTGKFYITYDEQSGYYWLTSNVNSDSMKNSEYVFSMNGTARGEGAQDERDKLGLYYSKNAMDWNFAGYVAKGNSEKEARSYASMVIDGEDLLVVSRSGNEKAASAHNTNQILFHRIKNFRSLANDSRISDETGGLVYSSDVLNDSSVKDVNIYLTTGGKNLVTCSVSDENGTKSLILLENADGLYDEKLTTNCKLGEPVKVGGKLYVFAVADGRLLVFTSTDEGENWSSAVTVDKTRNWYEAPSSAIVKDNQIMLALSVLDDSVEYEPSYDAIYGFEGDGNSFLWDKTERKAVLTGKGAVGYSEKYELAEGESVSVTMKPETLVSGTSNYFCIEFSDKPYAFYSEENKKEDGILFEWVSFTGSLSGANFWYRSIRDSIRGKQVAIKQGYTSADVSQETYTVTLTREEKTVNGVNYTGVITVADERGNIYHADIPKSVLGTSAYQKGFYISAGSNPGVATGKTYLVYEPKEDQEATWGVVTGSAGNLTVDASMGATFTNNVSAYYDQAITVQEGTKISVDVSFPSTTASDSLLYAFTLVDRNGCYYTSNAAANSLMAELSSGANSQTVNGVVAVKRANTNRAWKVNLTGLSTSRSTTAVYRITYEKINVTENGENYSWKITMEGPNAIQTYKVKASDIAHDMFADGAYFAAGIRDGAATHTMKVTSPAVQQPGDAAWEVINGKSYNLLPDKEKPADVTFANGLNSAYYNQAIAVQEGTKISVDVSFPSTTAGDSLLYAFTLVDRSGSYYTSNAAANSLMAELSSGAGSGTVNGVVAVKRANTNRAWKANLTGLSTSRSATAVYHITYEKINVTENGENYSWKITMEGPNATQTYQVKASDIAHDMFADGAYFAAGIRDGKATHTMKITNLMVTADDYTATSSVENAYKVKPVVMTAAVNADLTNAASWTCVEGKTFAEEFGNPYANNKFEYFGLPYEAKDARTIGWSDLKLFEVNDTYDMRGAGSVYGYLTLNNAGYNYAAMVKVDTDNHELTYFTNTTTNTITNEEVTVREVVTILPGGNNGFDVMYDSNSKMYWLVTTENVDTVNKADKSASKVSLYYSSNAYDWIYAGKVAETTGDARVSAVLNGDAITIIAVNNGVRKYTVSNLSEIATGCKWSVIRGVADYSIAEQSGKVVLTNHGAARSNEKIEVVEGTKISFKMKANQMQSGHIFAIGLLDTDKGFVNGTGDTGNGFVLRIAPWGKLNGASAYCLTVKDGVPASATNDNVLTSVSCDMDGSDGSSDYITAELVKRESTSGSWAVKVQIGNTWSKTYNIPIASVPNNLFDESGAYLVAGSWVNKEIEYEISDLSVVSPVLGDINGDGEINIIDAAAVDINYRNKGANEKTAFNLYERAVYDVDGDGKRAYADANALRGYILNQTEYTGKTTSVDGSANKVRLERKHYLDNSGTKMVSITLNTNFVCGGYEGVFTYDTNVLKYVGASYGTKEGEAGFNGRNNAANSVKSIDEGIMTVALGYASTGTKGDFVTLNFEVKDSAGAVNWADVAKFDMKDAIFSNVQGNVSYETSIAETMLGDANGDYEIDVRDLVKMKKQAVAGEYTLNSDCDRDDAATDADDCILLRQYLCSKIDAF